MKINDIVKTNDSNISLYKELPNDFIFLKKIKY